MTESEIKAALNDLQALTCTVVAEAVGDAADGSSVEERIAVACVIRNRVRSPGWWGDCYRSVCLKPWMFSCWNPGPDANHQRTMALAYQMITAQPISDLLVRETEAICDLVIRGIILDRIGGSDHYYAPKAMKPAGSAPKWAKKAGALLPPTAIVGSQHFYRLG